MNTIIDFVSSTSSDIGKVEVAFAILEKLLPETAERKDYASYLTIVGYRAGDIASVTKDLARNRSTKFDPQFRADVISGVLNSVSEVEAYIKASDSASENTLKKKAYFEKELKLSLDSRANERQKVYAELNLDSEGKAIKKGK